MTTEGLYFLEPLAEVVETVLYTAAVRGEIPVSVILVGPSGSAKSKLLKMYASPSIHVTDSITSAGLWEIVQKDDKNEKKFILIPDINPTLTRRSSTTQATIGNLLSITGDGTVRVDDGRGEKICKHEPIGLLTACTPEIYHRHAKQWFALGLRRRIIPIFYTYSVKTENELQKNVREDKIHSSFLPLKPIKIPLAVRPAMNGTFPFEFEKNSVQFANNLGKLEFIDKGIKKWQVKDVVPISPHVTIRNLAMAHAIRRKSMSIEQAELDFIVEFLSFTDPQMPRQI